MDAVDARAIREDIERTRARMGETVEALGERLNPARIKQQVKDNIREATIGRVQTMANNAKNRVEEGGRGLVATIRENPIPAAMIVGGLGWLLFARRGGDVEVPVTRPVISEYEPVLGENAHGSIDQHDGRVARVAGAVGDGASAAAHKVADVTGSAAHKVADVTGSAKDKVADAAASASHKVADVASSARGKVSDSFADNPLALGAIAAGVGLAIGMSIPSSDREARLMGGKRDELIDKARARVGETKDKVVSAAERIVPEVRTTVTETVRELKSSVKDTVKDVAREEGLTA